MAQMTGKMPPYYHPVLIWHYSHRVIHWVIAISVFMLIPLGLFLYFADVLKIPGKAADSVKSIHASIGFVFGAGVIARVFMLFKGPETALWRDVVPHTREQWKTAFSTIGYYIKGFKGEAPLYYAHNPFAGIAYTVFFIFAVTQTVSGSTMFLLAPKDGVDAAGAAGGAQWPPEALLFLHDLGALVIILFVMAHLSALVLHEIVERRGLVSSMISGYKFFNEDELKRIESQSEKKP